MDPTYPIEQFGLVLKAVEFSATKHRFQRRKSAAGIPYINHPIEVCRVLWDVAAVRDPIVLAAALLHDTLEDTETTVEELQQEFGERVTSIVIEVTDDKDLPKTERKRLQVEGAPHKSPEASLVKLADKFCNVRDMVVAPPASWDLRRRQEYVAWARSVVQALSHQQPHLKQLFDDCCVETEQQLQTLRESPGP